MAHPLQFPSTKTGQPSPAAQRLLDKIELLDRVRPRAIRVLAGVTERLLEAASPAAATVAQAAQREADIIECRRAGLWRTAAWLEARRQRREAS